MQLYVLITSDNTIGGIYTTKAQLITELTTVYAATSIKTVEI